MESALILAQSFGMGQADDHCPKEKQISSMQAMKVSLKSLFALLGEGRDRKKGKTTHVKGCSKNLQLI